MSHNYLGTRWDDLRVSVGLRTTGPNAPSLSQWQPGGSGNLRLYEFPANSLKEIFFEGQLPHGSLPNTYMWPHVHFSPSTTTATGFVIFGIEYTIKEVSSAAAFAAPTTIYYGYQFTANQQYKHLVTDIKGNPITLPTPATSAIVVGRLFRNGGVGSDTFADSVFMLAFDMHYQFNAVGSVTEF